MAGILPPVFLIFSLGTSVVYSGSHTLHYDVTIVSAPTPGVPRYLVSMYVDGVQYGRYNSDTCHAEALYPSLGALSEHIEKQTQYAQGYEMRQRRRLKSLNGYLNKTRGNGNIYQRRLACELYEDGTIGGYEEIAFDGQELLVYDKERVVYVPVTQEAEMLSFIWNIRCGPTDTKIYMENDCIEHIKLYLPYISTDLERKVPPNVNISSSESESGTKLHCRVYGFYPRDVEVKWIKNGRDEIHSEEAAQILPNPDGTYQIRVSVGVTPDKNSNYSCLVDHNSLETPIIVTFVPNNGRSHLYFIIPVSVIFLLLLIILGIFIYRKQMTKDSHGSHECVSISGESLNTDARPKAQEEQITHSSPEGLENSDEILRKVEKRHYPFYIKQVLKPQ
ncbi:major histocompatibility complex class I-related gene protein [Xenopus tropicalis]|uniref:Major histocompatibility complex class I-related gene protein n=1 Tax=Xenopus tropicalis TaxID=8364 RepID=A0A8J0QWT4_XENTR|nr:major histocompatibility complex class I-related gene protein [Xenopus tropicalis]|eukprot:XP_002940111.1 PREDICTED: major histocompatibility complex class I-related gene protein-like [Xenopus tropicalis]